MNIRVPNVVHTERDQSLLHYLFLNKVATFQQIHRDLFKAVRSSVPSRHIAKLLRRELITKVLVKINGRYRIVYGLDDEAKEFISYFDSELLAVNQLKSGTIGHDVQLVDVRERLQRFPMVRSIYPENALQCLPDLRQDPIFIPFVKLRSDSVLELSTGGNPVFVALELELSKKTPKRYEQKISDYYKWKAISGVLFVSGNREIQRSVQQIEQSENSNEKLKIFYALLEDVLKDGNEITFSNSLDGQFVLG
ncbi:MAG: hypothetical protein AB7F66_09210 [Bacteriovoracia bacterium]